MQFKLIKFLALTLLAGSASMAQSALLWEGPTGGTGGNAIQSLNTAFTRFSSIDVYCSTATGSTLRGLYFRLYHATVPPGGYISTAYITGTKRGVKNGSVYFGADDILYGMTGAATNVVVTTTIWKRNKVNNYISAQSFCTGGGINYAYFAPPGYRFNRIETATGSAIDRIKLGMMPYNEF